MEKKSFIKGAAILAIAGLIVKIIGAVYRIPLSNIIGSNGMSFYEVAYPYYSFLLVVSSAGLPTAISKMVSERVTLGDYRGAHQVFRTAFRMLLIIGVATSALMFFGADLLVSGTPLPEAALSLRALAPALLFVSLMCAYRGYLQGLQLMTGTAVSQVAEQVGKLGVGFALASVLLARGPQYAAMGALIGVSISELLALLIIAAFFWSHKKELRRAIKSSPKAQLPRNRRVAVGLLSVAIPVTIGASIMPITGIVDANMIMTILIDINFTLSQAMSAFTALRSYVTPLINMPAVLTAALAISLVPAISGSMARHDYKSVKRAAHTGMKLALLIGMPCAAGLFVLAKPIIGMLFLHLGEEQLRLAADLMHTAAIGVIFLSLVQTMTGVLQGMGKANVPVFNLIFGGIIKVITMLVLTRIPSINIQGAAVSTVACYAAAGILDTIYIVRKTGMKIQLWDVFGKPLIASGAMGLTVYLAYESLIKTAHQTLSTLTAVLIGVCVYGVLLLVLKAFSEEDLRLIPGGSRLKKLLIRR